MSINLTFCWAAAALVLGGLEIFTGTFYLLVFAFAAAVASACSWLGLSWTAQLAVFSAVAVAGCLALRALRNRNTGTEESAEHDRGTILRIDRWEPDGTARVMHRGAQWTAVPRIGCEAVPGAWRIESFDRNRLVVAPADAADKEG